MLEAPTDKTEYVSFFEPWMIPSYELADYRSHCPTRALLIIGLDFCQVQRLVLINSRFIYVLQDTNQYVLYGPLLFCV